MIRIVRKLQSACLLLVLFVGLAMTIHLSVAAVTTNGTNNWMIVSASGLGWGA